MEQFIENEIKITDIVIGLETFTVTNKRVLYSNGNYNTFIGIDELRGAETRDDNVKHSKFDINIEQLVLRSSIIIFLLVYCYFWFIEDSILSGFVFGFFGSLSLTATLAIIAFIIKKAATKQELLTLLTINKKDNTLFANQYYDTSNKNKIVELTNTINNTIYK
jgi:hypothetical protein